MLLTVELLNPPAEATEWVLTITDWDVTATLQWGNNVPGNILEVASFDVPESWTPPYRVIALHILRRETPLGSGEGLYYMQSFRRLLWDFVLFAWDGPDPTYRNAFIPDPSDYFYNVATEQFELKALPAVTITAPDSAAEGDTVPVSGVVNNLDPVYAYEFKTEIWVGTTLIETWQDPILAGQSKTYQTAFIMPGGVADVLIWVTRRSGSVWNFVGAATKDVALSLPPPAVEFRNFALADYSRV